MPDEDQAQARPRPEGNVEPVWGMVFDRFDAIDEDVRGIRGDFTRLEKKVNHERDLMLVSIASKVGKGEFLGDLWSQLKKNHVAQAICVAVVVALGPLIGLHWSEFIEIFKNAF